MIANNTPPKTPVIELRSGKKGVIKRWRSGFVHVTFDDNSPDEKFGLNGDFCLPEDYDYFKES